jgi:hypothetical protein
MTTDLKIISAQRSYEFRPDDLRLTALCQAGVIERINEAFQFNAAQVATPLATFGPVPKTYPPGLVFNYGRDETAAGRLIPIRLLHFEQRRIVMDVPGPTGAIDHIFERLMELVGADIAPDGFPVIGTPSHTREYSRVSLVLPFDTEALLAPNLRATLDGIRSRAGEAQPEAMVADIQVRWCGPDEEYPGLTQPDYRTFHLQLRAGSHPSERLYFSGAPVDTETHVRMLERLVSQAAAPDLPSPSASRGRRRAGDARLTLGTEDRV